jgi:hypothetical protein
MRPRHRGLGKVELRAHIWHEVHGFVHRIELGVGKDSSQKLTDLGMREKSEQF